jgi:hypothetical protein
MHPSSCSADIISIVLSLYLKVHIDNVQQVWDEEREYYLWYSKCELEWICVCEVGDLRVEGRKI